MSTVLCTSTHVIDLEDGRSLAPGEVAEDVDTTTPFIRSLVLDGHLLVQEGSHPRTRASEDQTAQAVADARTPKED